MQSDMHYYGTYALARAAGLKPDICQIIATSAQFVDDNAFNKHIEMLDGARIDSEATAHHVSDTSNIDAENQRQVWVPFHFLPGNEGESFSERLLCVKDSAIAREMVRNHLGHATSPISAYLMGITAHVYADTFSHFGFSGVSSRRNKVVNDSIRYETKLDPDLEDYLKGKEVKFFQRFHKETGLVANMKSWLAETLSGALGHGAVATYPDRPYLKWSFEYEYPQTRRVVRDNPKSFLEGAKALHGLFAEYAKRNPAVNQGDGVAFATISDAVKGVIAIQGDRATRTRGWKRCAKSGALAVGAFAIPEYKPEKWLKRSQKLVSLEDSSKALAEPIYLFFRAASYHRNYVLRELLPAHGLVVS